MFKRICAFFLIALMLMTSLAYAAPMILEGEGSGMGGIIKVSVTVDGGVIKEIIVNEHKETAGISDTAFETVPQAIIAEQSVMVDTVTGATKTSQAIIDAVKNALEKGGLNLADYEKILGTVQFEPKAEINKETEVLVVGGGVAGLATAMTAAEAGADVLLIERMPFLGGNAIISAGIIQAAGTSVQREHGIEDDSPEKFIADLANPDGKYQSDEKPLSHIMHREGSKQVEAMRARGLEFVAFQKEDLRMHIVAPELFKGGATLIHLLEKEARAAGAEIMLDTRATSLIIEDGRVVGVKAEGLEQDVVIRAKAVILATGGYSSNKEMVAKYLPELANINSRAAKSIVGDGIILAESAGGYAYAMDSGQQMFYVSKQSGIDVPLLLAFTPSIIVNKNGDRFVNESIDYNLAARACVAQPDSTGYIVFDEEVRRGHGTIDYYLGLGLVIEADTLEELADKIGVAKLTETVQNYNEMAKAGEDKDFQRMVNFKALETPKFYAIEVEPQIYNSYGGIKIDEMAHVVNKAGQPIPGLYAAGEVAGSPEVQEGLRYTSGLAQGLVFGEIAAETAIAEMNK
ncbi:MAG: flavocytochrome c [Christensenellales bacterium]|jgi:fumarate reductase flavoprotein subunit